MEGARILFLVFLAAAAVGGAFVVDQRNILGVGYALKALPVQPKQPCGSATINVNARERAAFVHEYDASVNVPPFSAFSITTKSSGGGTEFASLMHEFKNDFCGSVARSISAIHTPCESPALIVEEGAGVLVLSEHSFGSGSVRPIPTAECPNATNSSRFASGDAVVTPVGVPFISESKFLFRRRTIDVFAITAPVSGHSHSIEISLGSQEEAPLGTLTITMASGEQCPMIWPAGSPHPTVLQVPKGVGSWTGKLSNAGSGLWWVYIENGNTRGAGMTVSAKIADRGAAVCDNVTNLCEDPHGTSSAVPSPGGKSSYSTSSAAPQKRDMKLVIILCSVFGVVSIAAIIVAL